MMISKNWITSMDIPPSEKSYFSKTNILIYLLVADILIKLLWLFSILNIGFLNMENGFMKKKIRNKVKHIKENK